MTTRTDAYLTGLLRHLGATYYESLHDRATKEEVTRAVDNVTEHLNEHGEQLAEDEAASGSGHEAGRPGRPRFAPDAGRGSA